MSLGGLVFAVVVLFTAVTIFIRRRQGISRPAPPDDAPLRPPPDFEPTQTPDQATVHPAPDATPSSDAADGSRAAAAAGALVVGYMAAHALDDAGGGDTPDADEAGESDGDGDSGGDGGDGGGGD